MKHRGNLTRAVAVAGLLCLSGCDWRNSAPAKWLGLNTSSKPAATTGTQSSASGAAQSCANGKPAKAFQLNCAGSWSFVQRKDANQQLVNNCEFTWAQQTCEQKGMKPFKTPVCYGVTAMDLGAPGTAEQCAAKFGNPPKPITATLYCCEN